MSIKARLKYMDIAKGIGIICVLMGHTYANQICILVNTFHMPLFFIISGFFFTPIEKLEMKSNVRLLIPYGMTVAAFAFFSLMYGDYKEALIWVWGGVYGSGYDYETPFLIKSIGGIWFFLALFWVRIIVNEIIKFNEKMQLCIAILVTYVGVKTYSCFVLPVSIQNGMAATIFFFAGYYLKEEKLLKKINYMYMIFFLVIWFYCYKYYGNLAMVNCSIPNVMTVIGALCGSGVILYISMLLENKLIIVGNILGHIGRMTMVMLCVHIFELHTGVLVNIQNMLYETMHFSIHIFVLRCIWTFALAEIVYKCISIIQKKRI